VGDSSLSLAERVAKQREQIKKRLGEVGWSTTLAGLRQVSKLSKQAGPVMPGHLVAAERGPPLGGELLEISRSFFFSVVMCVGGYQNCWGSLPGKGEEPDHPW